MKITIKTWARRLLKTGIALLILATTVVAGACWLGNRPSAPVSPSEVEERFSKALGWLKANEGHVLKDQNPALWWMIQMAAQRTGDAYLTELTQRASLNIFGTDSPAIAWKRMIAPTAEVYMPPNVSDLSPYQRFFLHAVTCTPQRYADSDSDEFLNGQVCPPLMQTVLTQDPACTTHHVMGLDLFRQTGCEAPATLEPLREELLDDIAMQLSVDVVIKDAYLQRVLVLTLHEAPSRTNPRIKPIWVRRALEAQEADGGWLGHRRLPELPEKVQPWYWREWLAQYWPERFDPQRLPKDFHATAQGVLLLAVLKSGNAGAPAAQTAAAD